MSELFDDDRRKSNDRRLDDNQQLLTDNSMLDRINHMKIEFFQSMNHNIKTPLTVISTCIHSINDMIDFGDINEDEIKKLLNVAQQEIMRVSQLLSSNMKNLSLYDKEHQMEPVDIADFLREATEVYNIMLERRFNTLRIQVPKSLPLVSGNRDMLSQVLANLISNANRYTSGGEIVASADLNDDNIIITIRDTGSGISPDMLPFVFERGVSDGRTGLGLYICKMIIEDVHKGEIYVESSKTGTVFTIILPVLKADNKE